MTEDERLAKNNKIKEKGQETRLKRKSQVCRVFRFKIDFSHLNQNQREHLKMLFVEARWLYNDILTFSNEHRISEYDYKVQRVYGLDQDKNSVQHKLNFLSSQMKQAVINNFKNSLKSLSFSKKNNRKVGRLKYKSDYNSIDLQQHGNTYKFLDKNYVHIQGFKKKLKIEGTSQILDDFEFANAKLLNLPDGYYLAVTTFQNKGGEPKKYKSPIGIDMGIKTSITTSDGRKIKVAIEETKRLKKLQRRIVKRKKGSAIVTGLENY